MTTTIEPEDIRYVLLRGEADWLAVDYIEPGFWRLGDGTPSTRGKRGWVIQISGGEKVVVAAEAIQGVR